MSIAKSIARCIADIGETVTVTRKLSSSMGEDGWMQSPVEAESFSALVSFQPISSSGEARQVRHTESGQKRSGQFTAYSTVPLSTGDKTNRPDILTRSNGDQYQVSEEGAWASFGYWTYIVDRVGI